MTEIHSTVFIGTSYDTKIPTACHEMLLKFLHLSSSLAKLSFFDIIS